MVRKRHSRVPSATRAITTERTARLYQLLRSLAEAPQTRNGLTRQLRCDVRSFYRDLQLLRELGFAVPLRDQRYHLEGELSDALDRLPFPDPNLTLAEAQQLAVGRSAAHRKLQQQIAQIVPAQPKPKRTR
jgi:predicted DNA-binding transcriptional regulator YafY